MEPPHFDAPVERPEIPATCYLERIRRASNVAADRGFDVFVVYADREHSANLCYLTGYDPRFEEALFVMNLANGDFRPLLLVGNEGLGYARSSPVYDHLDVELYQSFSLLGQDRSESPPLDELLAKAGVTAGSRVGTAGWKHFSASETEAHETALEIPSYLADILRDMVGAPEVLPTSSIPAWLTPHLLDPSRAMAMVGR